MADWVGIAREFLHYKGTMSSFYRALCEAIIKADSDNLERLIFKVILLRVMGGDTNCGR